MRLPWADRSVPFAQARGPVPGVGGAPGPPEEGAAVAEGGGRAVRSRPAPLVSAASSLMVTSRVKDAPDPHRPAGPA